MSLTNEIHLDLKNLNLIRDSSLIFKKIREVLFNDNENGLF